MKRIRELIHWNISFSAFTEFREEIARTNLNSMKRISFVGMVGAALLSIASLPFINLLSMLKSYLVLTVLFSIVYVVSKTVLVKRADLVLPVYYAVITVMLTISILMGTVFGKDTNATTFILFIVTLPMFIVDKPYRVNILFAAASVIFCIADIHVKSGELLSLDISNSIVFYLLSLALSWQTIGIKVSDIIIKHELKQQRDMDMLTKLSNRSAFERVVAQYLHESNESAIMLIMDVDNFKQINDKMGHSAGDAVLQSVGEALKGAFRKGDIVSRLGGDEFVAFLPYAGDIGVVTEKVKAMMQRINEIKQGNEQDIIVSVSVGLAQYPKDGCLFEELYKRADKALYSAKNSGKGKIAVYTEELDDSSKSEAAE